MKIMGVHCCEPLQNMPRPEQRSRPSPKRGTTPKVTRRRQKVTSGFDSRAFSAWRGAAHQWREEASPAMAVMSGGQAAEDFDAPRRGRPR
jgi:hypothetical protein